jgi:thiosulfate/3-mercaptopyruvate sulfurtransferase
MPFGPLISPESLEALTPTVRVLDARPDASSYAEGHLEGALQADTDRQLSAAADPGFDPAKGGRHPLPSPDAWAVQLGTWGIGPETSVVVYDDASGANAAARLWWMLRASGHSRVAVLDRGLRAALAVGRVLTRTAPSVDPLPPYSFQGWQRPTVDIDTVELRAQDPAWKVIDVRSRERWRGEVEPLDPTPGRIPGSVNLPYSENLGPDGRFKSPADLRSLYLDLLGGVRPEHVIVHCGSGVTACHALLALELAGLDGASLYVGSYGEWCRRGRSLRRG